MLCVRDVMGYDAMVYVLAFLVIGMSIFVGISYLLENSRSHKHGH
jgi:hypothetical protein